MCEAVVKMDRCACGQIVALTRQPCEVVVCRTCRDKGVRDEVLRVHVTCTVYRSYDTVVSMSREEYGRICGDFAQADEGADTLLKLLKKHAPRDVEVALWDLRLINEQEESE